MCVCVYVEGGLQCRFGLCFVLASCILGKLMIVGEDAVSELKKSIYEDAVNKLMAGVMYHCTSENQPNAAHT